MSPEPEFPLRVFYDGSCYVCSSEMLVYMRKDHGGRLEFIDISAPDFNPDEYGISLADFMYQMHAVDRQGRETSAVMTADLLSPLWKDTTLGRSVLWYQVAGPVKFSESNAATIGG